MIRDLLRTTVPARSTAVRGQCAGHCLGVGIVPATLLGAITLALAGAPLAAQSAAGRDTAPATGRDTAGAPSRLASDERYELFPRGHLFAPLIAAPREPQFRNSYTWARSTRDLNGRIAVTEPGGTLSLLRRRGARPGDGLELSIQASVAAQFDMSSDHWDLLNADYTFSYPVSYRRGATSARLRFYHQSSHLGDEFVAFRDPRPEFTESFRIEAVDLVVARDLGRWRVYGGGEHAYSAAPAVLGRNRLHAGAEHLKPLGRWREVAQASSVVAAHLSSAQERAWSPGLSVRTGFELARGRATAERSGARYRALLELYSGPAPYGQFFRFDRVRSIGVGCYVIP